MHRPRRQTAKTLGLSLAILLMLPLSPIVNITTNALTTEQKQALDRGAVYFNTEVDSCQAGIDTGAELVGLDNEEKIMNFLFDKLSKEQVKAKSTPTNAAALAAAEAAGIVGNLMQESGLNPSSEGGPAHGIAQWEGGRWTALQAYVDERNVAIRAQNPGATAEELKTLLKQWNDLDIQLEYLWKEMPGQYVSGDPERGYLRELQAIIPSATTKTNSLQAVMLSNTPRKAAEAFAYTFERPDKDFIRIEKRIDNANKAFARHGSRLAGSQVAAIVDGDLGCVGVCSPSGEGYCFPIAPAVQKNYQGLPCSAPGEIPGYPGRGQVGVYTDRFGNSATIRTCHHAPLSPAFDLYYGPTNKRGTLVGASGAAIYAISKGHIEKIKWDYCNPKSCSASGKLCNSIQFKSSLDNHYYWYGHVLADPKFRSEVSKGKEIQAGEVLGKVATEDYGTKCWGGAPHLHIDRGCVDKSGTPHTGGNETCRHPKMMDIMANLWKGLPKQ